MEPSVYFFGSGLSPSRQDYTKEILSWFLSKARNENQIVIRRKGDVLHYGYVRRMGSGDYLGICLCLDRIYMNMEHMFSVFDEVYALMVEGGEIVKIGINGKVEWATDSFEKETVAVIEYSRMLVGKLGISDSNTMLLPPVDFSISINDCREISIDDPSSEIIDATTRYVNVYIARKKADIERVTSLRRIVSNKDKKISKLQQEKAELSKELNKAKAMQRNVTWVAILGIVVIVLGIVLWNKVLFPSEVTHKEMEGYVYYGPLNKDRNPEGVGVAKYHDDDGDGRRYYFGNFVNGERNDTTAVLLYQQGNYFYGTIEGDTLKEGMYVDSHHNFFIGTFRNNKPYDGGLSQYKEIRKMVEGEVR